MINISTIFDFLKYCLGAKVDMRLLVADDEVNLAKALQAVLEDAGYNCDVCFIQW